MACTEGHYAIPYIPDTYLTTPPSWGTKAVSSWVLQHSKTGWYSFRVPTTSAGVVVGLVGVDDPITDYRSFMPAIHFRRGQATLRYKKTFPDGTVAAVETSLGIYLNTDSFKIARNAHGRATVYKNDTVLVSDVLAFRYEDVRLAADLYAAGDTVLDMVHGDSFSSAYGSLAPLQAFSGLNSHVYATLRAFEIASGRAVSSTSITPFTSTSGVKYCSAIAVTRPLETREHGASARGALKPFQGESYSGKYCHAIVSLLPFESQSDSGLLSTDTTICHGAMAQLTGAATALTGTIGGTYGRTDGYALDDNASSPVNTLRPLAMPPFDAQGSNYRHTGATAQLAAFLGLSLEAFKGSYADLYAGSYQTLAHAIHETPNSAQLTYYGYSMFSAFGGAFLLQSAPYAINAAGTVPTVGRVDTDIGAYRVDASASISSVAGVVQSIGNYALNATSGGRVSITGGAVSAYASGISGSVVAADLSWGGYGVLATGQLHGRVIANVFVELVPTTPGVVFTSFGTYAVLAGNYPTLPVERLAYAVNLGSGAVSRYPTYPFDKLVRLGADYFAIKSDGVFRLGGGSDELVDIPARIQTFYTSFSNKHYKRVPVLYLSGSVSNTLEVGVEADGGTEYTYNSNFGTDALLDNHRVIVGKGIRGVYYRFSIAAVGGGFSIDSAAVDRAQTDRRV